MSASDHLERPMLTARFWRNPGRIAGIIFGVLLITALTMVRIALAEGTPESLQTDAQRRTLIRIGLNLVPFAGIAFLWFIGVIREQIGHVEDRLFSTVFLGSGLLFLAMMFAGAVTSASMLEMLLGREPQRRYLGVRTDVDAGTHFGMYAMRMAAVFTLSVSTLALRTSALPRWVPIVGYAVALVLLFGAGEQKWSQLVFPAWVLMVSVVILLTRPPARPAPTNSRVNLWTGPGTCRRQDLSRRWPRFRGLGRLLPYQVAAAPSGTWRQDRCCPGCPPLLTDTRLRCRATVGQEAQDGSASGLSHLSEVEHHA